MDHRRVTDLPLLVGREREVQLIADAISEAGRGKGRLLLIEGEAGSGKTTLLDEVVAGAVGFRVFRTAAHEIDRNRPFGMIADALEIAWSSADPDRKAVAGALREGGSDGFGEALRYRIVEDIVALLERDALARPVVLALDDLHWADDSSLLAVHHVARRIAHLPVALIAARRPPLRNPGPDPLAFSGGDHEVERVRLAPLDDEQVAQLATRVLGVAPAPALRSLLGKAGGNPFFVTELLAALREDRSIAIDGITAEVAMSDVRPELRMVILRRLSGLAPTTVNVLRMASILGETFAARDLAIVLGYAPTDVVEPLDEAITAGVLRPEADRLAFRHDLVRGALYGDVPLSVRNALHLQAGHALLGAGAPPSQAAPHFAAGAAPGDDAAIRCLQVAAADLAATEPKTAHRWLSRALELLSPGDDRRDQIVVEMSGVLLAIGDGAAAVALAREALQRNQPRERRLALQRLLAAALDHLDRCLDAAAISEDASMAEDMDERDRIRFAADAVEYRVHVDPVPAEPAARVVLQRAQSAGDDVASRRTLAALFHAANWRGDFHAAATIAQQIKRRASASDPLVLTGGMDGRALAHIGRYDEALESLRSEMRAHERQRDMRPMSLILTQLAQLEARAGQWDEAISDAEAAKDLAAEFRQLVRHDEAAALLAILATRRAEVDRATRLLSSLVSARRFVAALAMARLAEARSDKVNALTILREAWELAARTGRGADLPRYAPDLIRLELTVGDRVRAAEAAVTVEAIAISTGVSSTKIMALRCQGLAAGDPVRSIAAVEQARVEGLPDDLAAALEDAGKTMAAAGRRDESVACLREALMYYESVSATYDVRRTEANLRALGVRRGRRGPRPKAQIGWASLTETERRVVELAVEGRTNAEIGARLFISGRTVERHLTHVYAKLGVASRVELAGQAASMGRPI